MGGGSDVEVYGQVGEEGFDFRGSHIFGMSFVVEEDEAFDPVDVGFLGADGVVFEADGLTNSIEQSGLFVHFVSPRGSFAL